MIPLPNVPGEAKVAVPVLDRRRDWARLKHITMMCFQDSIRFTVSG